MNLAPKPKLELDPKSDHDPEPDPKPNLHPNTDPDTDSDHNATRDPTVSLTLNLTMNITLTLTPTLSLTLTLTPRTSNPNPDPKSLLTLTLTLTLSKPSSVPSRGDDSCTQVSQGLGRGCMEVIGLALHSVVGEPEQLGTAGSGSSGVAGSSVRSPPAVVTSLP